MVMFNSYVKLPEGKYDNFPTLSGLERSRFGTVGYLTKKENRHEQGLVNVPFWVYWTSPKIVAIWLTIYLMVG